ncbi:N-acetylneuraminate synthase [Parabacteroides sp. FAFU027]|uniref:N-acetylneuraminate synthase n=1 Tax=Parabacteroides sp. FAFU027 TaxID=2922715 RepID=UPI001FAF586A|nr:N-acetylneuraminate synthase [Parabacteroides sp. FAFU027]
MNRVIIIAEAGVNHNGDYELAKKMVVAAKEAGADYVKFQTAIPELVMSKFAPKAEYQLNTTDEAESQLEMARAIHLTVDKYKPLKAYCEEVGIKFLSTPFDMVSIDVLAELDMDYFKIPSGEITNYPYLKKIGQFGKPVIMSCGMSELDEISAAIDVLVEAGAKRDEIIILHCNTEYPTPYGDVNLRAMQTIGKELNVKVGYSDHTNGIEVPVAAVALGAIVIEKHFTLDNTMEGPDHKASLEPDELKAMIDSIRHIEAALGSANKHVTDSERKNMIVARKSILAAREIKAGETFTEENLIVKRPGNGVSPMRWNEVIGQKAKRDFSEDELIEL